MKEKFDTAIDSAAFFRKAGLERPGIPVSHAAHSCWLDSVFGQIAQNCGASGTGKLPGGIKWRFGLPTVGMAAHNKIQIIFFHDVQNFVQNLHAFRLQGDLARAEHDVGIDSQLHTHIIRANAGRTLLLLLLFCLILRAASYEFRSKVESAAWRKSWDCVHFIVNILACVVLGVFFANLFMGIPVDANGVYQGNLLKLFNIYGIAGGIFFTLIFMMHGAIWLTIKTRGPLQAKAFLAAGMLWVGVAAMLIIFLILTLFYTNIYSNY